MELILLWCDANLTFPLKCYDMMLLLFHSHLPLSALFIIKLEWVTAHSHSLESSVQFEACPEGWLSLFSVGEPWNPLSNLLVIIQFVITKHLLQHLVSRGEFFSQFKKIIAHMMFSWNSTFWGIDEGNRCVYMKTCSIWTELNMTMTLLPCDCQESTTRHNLLQCTVAFAHGVESVETFWTD